MGLKDSLQQARLSYFLVARRGQHDNGPGMASLLQPTRTSRQPWRRLALFRLMYFCCRDSAETVSFSHNCCMHQFLSSSGYRQGSLFITSLLYLAASQSVEIKAISPAHEHALRLQVAKLVRSFPGILSTQNITSTYHALAPDKISAIVMDEIRDFLQELLELKVGHLRDAEGNQDQAV